MGPTLEDILTFVDRNGTVTAKRSNPMFSSLEMVYESGKLKIAMYAHSHAMGNGSCGAAVVFDGKTVYDAVGSFTSRPYNVEVRTYEPGSWEKLIG